MYFQVETNFAIYIVKAGRKCLLARQEEYIVAWMSNSKLKGPAKFVYWPVKRTTPAHIVKMLKKLSAS